MREQLGVNGAVGLLPVTLAFLEYRKPHSLPVKADRASVSNSVRKSHSRVTWLMSGALSWVPKTVDFPGRRKAQSSPGQSGSPANAAASSCEQVAIIRASSMRVSLAISGRTGRVQWPLERFAGAARKAGAIQ